MGHLLQLGRQWHSGEIGAGAGQFKFAPDANAEAGLKIIVERSGKKIPHEWGIFYRSGGLV